MATTVLAVMVLSSPTSHATSSAAPRRPITGGLPTALSAEVKQSFVKTAMKVTVPVASLTMMSSSSSRANAADAVSASAPASASSDAFKADAMPLPPSAYTTLGDGMPMCRLLNGMWQLSGAHGFEPQFNKALAEMSHSAEEGFTTFDLADHYGPAEEYVGGFSKGRSSSPLSKKCQFFTKWVPMPVEITRKMATEAIDTSLRRMQTDRLDLLQFHWWDYKNKYYYDALDHLMHLQEDGKIRNIGLTNFDTEHLVDLMEQGAPIVSNQIAYSIIDTRPQKKMAAYCTENDVKLLCYGTLMGGFVSSDWLSKPMPALAPLRLLEPLSPFL